MAERITSKTNSTLQHIRRLLTSRKYRYECRSFVADGVKLVDEALHWSIRVEPWFCATASSSRSRKACGRFACRRL